MEHHDYANIWPLIEGDQFEQLKADIKKCGLRMNIITYQGKILDGRNRELACQAVGVTPRYSDAGVADDQAAIDLVNSLNLQRRHLTEAQRAFAAEKLAILKQGQFPKSSREPLAKISKIETIEQAAKTLGSSPASVKRARVIRKYGTEQDVKDVLEGRASLKARAHKVRPPKTRGSYKPKQSSQSKPRVSTERELKFYNGSGPKYLTPQEVDPEFTGTPMEFVAKYGHVQVHTAQQRATMRFADLAQFMRSVAKYANGMPVLQAIDLNWLRAPEPNDVAKLTEALQYLRPLLNKAETALERAVEALGGVKQKTD
jgi:hypothetical protein